MYINPFVLGMFTGIFIGFIGAFVVAYFITRGKK